MLPMPDYFIDAITMTPLSIGSIFHAIYRLSIPRHILLILLPADATRIFHIAMLRYYVISRYAAAITGFELIDITSCHRLSINLSTYAIADNMLIIISMRWSSGAIAYAPRLMFHLSIFHYLMPLSRHHVVLPFFIAR